MSYKLNKTDGTLLVDLIDGQVDLNTTDIGLVGRNYQGYGEIINENFIKLVENFSHSAAPSNPLRGQLWYDTSEQKLKIFNGINFQNTNGAFVQGSAPSTGVAGDIWIDNAKKQLYANDGTSWILIGPQFDETQGLSGFIPEDILDNTNNYQTVLKIYTEDSLHGLISGTTFTPASTDKIDELVTEENPTGEIFKGFNIFDQSNFIYHGTVNAARSLVDQAGTIIQADQFLPNNKNGITVGTLAIQNSGGLLIGLSSDTALKIASNAFNIENQLIDKDIKIRIRSSFVDETDNTIGGGIFEDALTVSASTRRVGIFNNNPQYTFDVTGDLRVSGNFLVEGDTVQVDVTELRVEDNTIEIASPSSGALSNDATIDGAGIIIKSSDSDKTLLWDNTNASLTSSEDFNLDIGKVYRIDGNEVLTATSLSSNITDAPGLIRIGSLESLSVDNLTIDSNTISSGTGVISFAPGGSIQITDNSVITGLGLPVNPSDATTKDYVDNAYLTSEIYLTLDTTGFVNVDAEIINILEFMYPANIISNSKQAKIHTYAYTGTVSGINLEDGTTKTYIDVNSGAGQVQNESVLQDVGFSTSSTGDVSLVVTRANRVFEIISGIWTAVS